MCKSEIFAEILNVVGKETEVSTELILSSSKVTEVVDARSIVVFFLAEYGLYPEQIVGRDNYGVQGGGSQNISGNMVNVTMPESGTQKIIKPTGEVEIQRLDPSDKSNSGELDRLQQRIQDLERIISEKDATIKSKDDLICVLKEMLNRQ